MGNTTVREVEFHSRGVGHRRGLVLVVVAVIAATLGAWIVMDGGATREQPDAGASAVMMDPIYRLERDPIGMSFWGYEAALPGDLVVEQVSDVTAVRGVAETYRVWAVVPAGSEGAACLGGGNGWGDCDSGWRGIVQRLAVVPATAAALEAGDRDLAAFLLAALDGTEDSRANPDTLRDVGGVRVASRDIGWGMSDYTWYRDGALYVYHGGPDWVDPLLAIWFAHPELVAVAD